VRLTHVLVSCADVARSLVFYQGLGLKPIVLDHQDDGTLRYARLVFPEGDATLSLERAAGAAVATAVSTTARPGVVLYFEHADLERRVAALAAAGYVFATGVETKPWLWREATLVDPDGHRLCLFQAGSYRVDPPWRLTSAMVTASATATAGEAAEGVSPTADAPSAASTLPAAGAPDASLASFLATRNRGYVDGAIPSGRDQQIDAYLERLTSLGAGAREQAADALGPAYTATFLAYAERMATLAARAGAERPARLGVLAVALTWRGSDDVRPAIPLLGLLYDAVKRAGGDPKQVFTETAAICPADVAPVLTDFLTRGDLDEIAEEMGFSGGRDRDGFRYRRLWGAGRIDADE